MKKVQSGFTLIELITVIVILGILAATALPRFINVTNDARFAAVNGVGGGLRSAVAVVQARYFATGNLAATTVPMADGTTVNVSAPNGIPAGTLAGIGAAMNCGASATNCNGITTDYTTATAVTFLPSGAPAACVATYNGTSGAVTVPATIASC